MKLKILKVSFDTEIEPTELSAFRGAIVKKVGREFDLFHNHLPSTEEDKPRYNYRYPLIQYKLEYRKPTILFIDEAVDHAKHFFGQSNWDLMINEKQHTMTIKHLEMKEHELAMAESFLHYRLYGWMALNQENKERFDQAETLIQKVELLEKILASNIISFANGVGWKIPEKFTVQLTDNYRIYSRSFKEMGMKVFNISFRTDLQLPTSIGIGRASSLGFGVLRKIKSPITSPKKEIAYV